MNKKNPLDDTSLSANDGAFVVRDETSLAHGRSKDRNSHFLTDSHHLPSHFVLEKCVTANISRPQVAPISKDERKRALVRANFYSECLAQGIKPDDANEAALDADTLFNKWWVATKFKEHEMDERHPEKRRKMDDRDQRQDNAASMGYALSSENDTADTTDISVNRPCHSMQMQTPRDIHRIPELKANLVQLLRRHNGDTTSFEFHSLVNTLGEFYSEQGTDQRWTAANGAKTFNLDGTWLALSKSDFTGSIGKNEKGEFLFTLGRVAFDMFRPTGLLCSIQGVFNVISPWDPDRDKRRPVIYPASLKARTEPGRAPLRKYE